MLIGILATTAGRFAAPASPHGSPQPYHFGGPRRHGVSSSNIGAALRIGLVEIVFVFLFIDLFDNIGTLVAVGKKAGLFDHANRIPRVNRILLSDAVGDRSWVR